MPVLRVRFHHELLGGHVHMGVFANIVPKTGYDHGYTLGKCGDLTMREEEFALFRGALDRAPIAGIVQFEFVEKQHTEA